MGPFGAVLSVGGSPAGAFALSDRVSAIASHQSGRYEIVMANGTFDTRTSLGR